jgi:hypothetical protein
MPVWIETFFRQLPDDFTGKIELECYHGDVTSFGPMERQKPPRLARSVHDHKDFVLTK